MLKKEYRLKVRTKFKNFKTVSTLLFTLKYEKNEKEVSNFGVIVSKKVDLKATVRNRIRRQITSCLEKNLGKIKPGFNFLFIAKKEAIDKKTEEINKMIIAIIKEEELIK
ncbi:MAG: ribonuclease P protein component [Candidatus Levyibacteriota bacterium]